MMKLRNDTCEQTQTVDLLTMRVSEKPHKPWGQNGQRLSQVL